MLCPFLGGEELGPYLTQCGLGRDLRPYQVIKWYLDPSSRFGLATTDIGRKLGAAVPRLLGEVDAYLTQCGLGRGLPPYRVAS